jgi:hypothetical protein
VAGSDRPWYLTVFGAFALAFPGFVLGYFSVGDGTVDQAVTIYGSVYIYALGSFALLGTVTFLTRASVERIIPVSAAAAAAGFYWYAAPPMATTLGLSTAFGPILRVSALAFVAFWLLMSLKRARAVGDAPLRS